LWEGRYKACLVDTDDYLLRCYRYIELNPVRAGMVASPERYRWSSHGANGLALHDPLVRPHSTYMALATTMQERCATYRQFVAETQSALEIDDVRLHLQRQYAFGSNRFRAAIEAQLGRSAGPAKIGRPSKARAPQPPTESTL